MGHYSSQALRRSFRRLLQRGLVVALGTALLTGSALAAGNIRIKGSVTDRDGVAVIGAKVLLTPIDGSGNPSGEPAATVDSNKKGRYTFGFTKPGEYRLEAADGDLQMAEASIRFRGAQRKPVYGPDGRIEDWTGPVDPADPHVVLGIPPDAETVEVDLVLGTPAPATGSALGGDHGAAVQIVTSGLGEEVESVLARLEAGQYEQALGAIDDMLADNADLAPLHYVRGFALVKLNRLDEAGEALEESLRLDPELHGASGVLGQVLGEQGRFGEAAEAMRRELSYTEEPATRFPLLLGLGQALFETGEVDAAIAALEEAHRFNPDNKLVNVHLANAYIRSDQGEKAAALIPEDGDPAQTAILHYNLAASLLKARQYESGARHMEKALELNPELAEAHKFLAQAYLSSGKMSEAISEYVLYLQMMPEAADAEMTRKLIEALKKNL